MAEHVECPECGKNAVVQRNDNLYQCLSCDFKRDLSDHSESQTESDRGMFWAIIVTAILSLLFLQARNTFPDTPDLAVQSSRTSTTINSETN